MRLRLVNSSPNSLVYFSYRELALGARLANVHMQKMMPGRDQVSMAKPNHSVISP